MPKAGIKQMNGEQEQKKQTFIRERIVGRKLSAAAIMKRLFLALLCGCLLGGGIALGFWTAGRLLPEETNQAQAESQSQETEAPEESAAAEPEAEPKTDESGADTSHGATETVADETNDSESIRALIREELSLQEEETAANRQAEILQLLQQTAADASHSLVAVQAVRRDTGWFNDPIETSRLASGMILSVDKEQIRILTTDAAVRNADSLSVIFEDGNEAEAELRQNSETDGIALLVADAAQLPEECLTALLPIEAVPADPQKPGTLVIAVGSPLSAAGSVDFGTLGYVATGETIADGMQTRFYVSTSADAGLGTFFLNTEGQLLGMACTRTGSQSATGAEAVAVSYLRRVLPVLTEGEKLPYLGIYGRTVTEELEAEGMPVGVYVTDPAQDSPAYTSGLKRGDIITEVDGTEVRNLTAFEAAVSNLTVGEDTSLTVMRGQGNGTYGELSFTMTVANR